jgi:hypothetical protein
MLRNRGIAAAAVLHKSTMQSLTTALSSLGLSDVEAPHSNNVNDVCRTHLTRLIAEITGALPSMVSPAIQCSQSLDKGDFMLATPALRLKDIDPGALALKLQQVWYRYRYVVPASRRDADPPLPPPPRSLTRPSSRSLL